jgi:HEAT repeat protein
LKSSDARYQAAVIQLLGELREEGATKLLMDAYPQLSADAQAQTLTALANRGEKGALPLARAATASPSANVKIAALNFIGILGDSSSVMLLAGTAASSPEEEAAAARTGLYLLKGADVDQVILNSLEKAEQNVKVELIRAIDERRISAATEYLFSTARTSRGTVRRECIRALRQLIQPKDTEALLALLLDSKSETDRTESERSLSFVLKKYNEIGIKGVVSAYNSTTDIETRGSLLQVFGLVGNPEALPILREALKSNDDDLRRSAILSVSEWPDATLVGDLLAVAKSEKSETHQILAIRGYLKLLVLPNLRTRQQTVAMLAEVRGLAKQAQEKKGLLAILQTVPCAEALEMAKGMLNDPDVAEEAQTAVNRIQSIINRVRQ